MNPYLHSFTFRLGNSISIMMSVIIKNEKKRGDLGFVERGKGLFRSEKSEIGQKKRGVCVVQCLMC